MHVFFCVLANFCNKVCNKMDRMCLTTYTLNGKYKSSSLYEFHMVHAYKIYINIDLITPRCGVPVSCLQLILHNEMKCNQTFTEILYCITILALIQFNLEVKSCWLSNGWVGYQFSEHCSFFLFFVLFLVDQYVWRCGRCWLYLCPDTLSVLLEK